MIQTSKDKFWVDEAGIEIPYNRTTKLERLKEASAKKLVNQGLSLNNALSAYKSDFKKLCDIIYAQAAIDNNIKPDAKGNFTWHSFDRSVKIEVNISGRIDFDDLTLKAAKEHLDTFLSEAIDSKIEFASEIVVDAFQTTRGKVDAKKVLSLLKWRDKIKHKEYQAACTLIEKGIRRPDSKTYYRISIADESGEHKAIELNFSNI
jgi:hypothetical protein